MTADNARIRLTFAGGAFEVEGPVQFVTKQSEKFGAAITAAIAAAPHPTQATPGVAADVHPPSDVGDTSNVLHVEGTTVKVLVDLPGSTQKEKTQNAALLVGIALNGDSEISFDTVRAVCEDHSCLNKGNFTAYLKDEKKLLLTSGSGKSQTFRLTQPGKTAAKKLLSTLAHQSG